MLANLYDVRTKLGREILNELKRKFGPLMCHTFINFNTKLREGASFGQPITEYDPGSMGFRDFVRLARELIAAGGPELVPTTLLRQADDLADKAEKLLATSKPLFGKNGFDGTTARHDARPPPSRCRRRSKTSTACSKTDDGVLFVAQAPGANRVQLAGDFNNWSPDATPMLSATATARCFRALLPLAPAGIATAT